MPGAATPRCRRANARAAGPGLRWGGGKVNQKGKIVSVPVLNGILHHNKRIAA